MTNAFTTSEQKLLAAMAERPQGLIMREMVATLYGEGTADCLDGEYRHMKLAVRVTVSHLRAKLKKLRKGPRSFGFVIPNAHEYPGKQGTRRPVRGSYRLGVYLSGQTRPYFSGQALDGNFHPLANEEILFEGAEI